MSNNEPETSSHQRFSVTYLKNNERDVTEQFNTPVTPMLPITEQLSNEKKYKTSFVTPTPTSDNVSTECYRTSRYSTGRQDVALSDHTTEPEQLDMKSAGKWGCSDEQRNPPE